jgi:hypothetical protein
MNNIVVLIMTAIHTANLVVRLVLSIVLVKHLVIGLVNNIILIRHYVIGRNGNAIVLPVARVYNIEVLLLRFITLRPFTCRTNNCYTRSQGICARQVGSVVYRVKTLSEFSWVPSKEQELSR